MGAFDEENQVKHDKQLCTSASHSDFHSYSFVKTMCYGQMTLWMKCVQLFLGRLPPPTHIRPGMQGILRAKKGLVEWGEGPTY